jgi:hypothetical protein
LQQDPTGAEQARRRSERSDPARRQHEQRKEHQCRDVETGLARDGKAPRDRRRRRARQGQRAGSRL